MKKLMTLLSLVSVVFLVGCNTMAGMGQDIQKGGEKIEDAAKKK